MSRVAWSSDLMATNAKNENIHDDNDETSRMRGLRIPGRVGKTACAEVSLSNCWRREILSVMSSRISTNCPDRIRSTSFAGKGSVAGERLTACVVVMVGIGRLVCIEPEASTGWEEDQHTAVTCGPTGEVDTNVTDVTELGGGRRPRVVWWVHGSKGRQRVQHYQVGTVYICLRCCSFGASMLAVPLGDWSVCLGWVIQMTQWPHTGPEAERNL